MVLTSRPWGLFITGAALILGASGVAAWLVAHEHQRVHNLEMTRQLLAEARVVREVVRAQWPRIDAARTAALLRALQAEGLQVALVSTEGEPLAEIEGGPDTRTLLTWPEVQDALRRGAGSALRAWGEPSRDHAMVALPIGQAPDPPGVLWLARPLTTMAEHPTALGRLLALGAVLVGALALAFAALLLRLRQRAFTRAIEVVRNLSAGDLSSGLEVEGADEAAALSSSLNALRRRLASQVETIDRQRRMLQALVDHLGEGVVVADAEGRIVLANPAAVRLLGIATPPGGRGALAGRPVEACIRNLAAQRLLLGQAADGGTKVESGGETYVPVEVGSAAVHLVARVSEIDLADAEAKERKIGHVVVLTDVTELERTIEMRTDFVANASHELRTPLATIRVAVETLLAMDLEREGATARRFLEKVDRHSERLQQMVADLLDLSRLESPAERFEPEWIELKKLVQELQFRFADVLERKQLRWDVRIEPADLARVRTNPHLLRLVLDNLVDNAIHFTDAGTVGLEVVKGERDVTFVVRDTGCGIPVEEHERIFERFYQVQRSRSGAERGTGLGLSIVRHAVDALRGEVHLESAPGRGTTVRVTVPAE